MSGVLVKVLPKTSFDFGSLGISGQTITLPLGAPIDITDYPSVGVVVRVHAASIGVNNFVLINLYEDGFLDGSAVSFSGLYNNSVTLDHSAVGPSAQFFYSFHMLSQFATVGMIASNGGTSSLNQVTISVDAVLKNGDWSRKRVVNGMVVSDDQYDGSPVPIVSIPSILRRGPSTAVFGPASTSSSDNSSSSTTSTSSDRPAPTPVADPPAPTVGTFLSGSALQGVSSPLAGTFAQRLAQSLGFKKFK